ncbi:F-actin-capping protein subunit alpha [Folsomia candida]|uniref:F-actin-capping protein subunit alpha n=1 Tax=Folsomia candida TaxID=158441 RepID=A0A226EX85_FOLCA|nr:F-actin-capping protein subunit alpha [Folsomia candida]OXA62275.1 F-actin-capping protein subunit alpha [Folsomia candida]
MSSSELDEPITSEEKVRIVSDFILHSPPGEFNEVFNDVRTLLNNDTLLKEGASSSFAQYNKDQLTPCRVQGSEQPVVISEHNDLGGGRFYDPKTKQSFKYDHLKKEASDFQSYDLDKKSEPWRSALETEFGAYVSQHYPHGVYSIFSKSSGGIVTVIVCIEDHQFQPKNFWNGRWRSQWTVSFDPSAIGEMVEVKGVVKVQVHYYEDGNVQLVSSKDIKQTIQVANESEFALEFVKLAESSESEYHNALIENYQTMSDTTFKALRRLLPVTRTKIDWNKIVSYTIGKELRAQ